MSDLHTSRPDLTAKAKDAVRDIKAKAANLSDGVTRTAKDAGSQLGEAAQNLASTAKEKVDDAVAQRKSLGADYIGSIAQATSRAANEFDADVPQAAQYIRQASEQIQGVADTIRNRDVRELVGEVQNFARQQPTLFFGGAVVLGFAALRFLKSTPQSPTGTQSSAFDANSSQG